MCLCFITIADTMRVLKGKVLINPRVEEEEEKVEALSLLRVISRMPLFCRPSFALIDTESKEC